MSSRNGRGGSRTGRRRRGRRLDRRTALAGGLAAAAALTFPTRALAHGRSKKRLQDLTHVFTEGFPVFTFDTPTRTDLVTIPTGGF